MYHSSAAACLAAAASVLLGAIVQAPLGAATRLGLILLDLMLWHGTYRLSLHPLAKLPGPIFAALTDFYTIYYCLAGNRHLDFHHQHEKYRTVFRFGPNRVSVCSAGALNEIYGVRANTQKSQVYAAFMHFFTVPASITCIDRRAHRFKRSVTTKALNPTSVKEIEELIIRNVRVFCSLLERQASGTANDQQLDKAEWSKSHDMTRMFAFLLSDIMGDVTFSNNWEVQIKDKNRPIVDLLPVGTCGINLAGHIPTVLKLKLESVLFPSLMRGIVDFQALSENQASWRMQQADKLQERDLFQSLLDARDPETGQGFSVQDLIAEAGFLIIAGADTTATALTATVFYLTHNPEALQLARKEVDVIFGNGGVQPDVEAVRLGEKLNDCKYLTACIDEAMRMSPPVAAMLPREVLAGGIRVTDDLLIPEGTDVGVPIYALHHDREHHPDPHTFHPERWIEGAAWTGGDGVRHVTSLDDIHRRQAAFAAFGWGRTSCVGKYLAYQEMKIVLARMLLLYDMRIEAGSTKGQGAAGLARGRQRSGEFQLTDTFTSTHQGPDVQFRRRTHSRAG